MQVADQTPPREGIKAATKEGREASSHGSDRVPGLPVVPRCGNWSARRTLEFYTGSAKGGHVVQWNVRAMLGPPDALDGGTHGRQAGAGP